MRQDEPELRPLGAFLLVLVQLAAFMTTTVLAQAFLPDDEGGAAILARPWNIVVAGVVGPLMALYVGLNRYAGTTPAREALRLGRPRGRALLIVVLAVVAGAALAPVGLWLNEQVVALVSNGEPAAAAPVAQPLGGRIIAAIGMILAYPVVVELFYRGFLQPRLSRSLGARKGFAVTLLLYAGSQIIPIPSEILVGALVGLLAWSSGGTWAAIAGHVGYNATGYLMLALGELR